MTESKINQKPHKNKIFRSRKDMRIILNNAENISYRKYKKFLKQGNYCEFIEELSARFVNVNTKRLKNLQFYLKTQISLKNIDIPLMKDLGLPLSVIMFGVFNYIPDSERTVFIPIAIIFAAVFAAFCFEYWLKRYNKKKDYYEICYQIISDLLAERDNK